MRVILKTLARNLVTLPFFILLSFMGVSLKSSCVGNVFFTVAGIIFSICISQIMSFDLSPVVNDTLYGQFSKALKNIQTSFLTEFAVAAIAFLSLSVLDSMQRNFSVEIKRFTFCASTELHLLVIFSVPFFLINYLRLYDKKNQIANQIRKEKSAI